MATTATANNRVVPDDYPVYITDRWVSPSRIARIYQLLEEDKKFTPADMLRIQGDIVSLPDRFLAEQLLAAGAKAGQPSPRQAQAQPSTERVCRRAAQPARRASRSSPYSWCSVP
mgnify:CR=1 FL=1